MLPPIKARTDARAVAARKKFNPAMARRGHDFFSGIQSERENLLRKKSRRLLTVAIRPTAPAMIQKAVNPSAASISENTVRLRLPRRICSRARVTRAGCRVHKSELHRWLQAGNRGTRKIRTT